MRLQAARNGSVYATAGRYVLKCVDGGRFNQLGQLPLPNTRRDRLVYRMLTSGQWQSVIDRFIGRVATVNLWPLSAVNLLASVGRQLFISDDAGKSWQRIHRLPDSSGPMGVLPSAIEHHDGVTYLGEYPLSDAATPHVLVSNDYGRSWSEHISIPNVRHIHSIQRDPYTGDIWVTTGDRDSESKIGRLTDDALEAVGGGNQMWRTVELAFTSTAILWGMDCAYTVNNRIFKLQRREITTDNPSPATVGRTPGSVYYGESITVGDEELVVFSTAMETGQDSTGPANQADSSPPGVVVATSSASGFTDWHQLLSYNRRRVLADSLPRILPRANGYVFLAADQEQGLFVNPFNTSADDGVVHQYLPERIASVVNNDT